LKKIPPGFGLVSGLSETEIIFLLEQKASNQ